MVAQILQDCNKIAYGPAEVMDFHAAELLAAWDTWLRSLPFAAGSTFSTVLAEWPKSEVVALLVGCLHYAEVSGLPHKLLHSNTPDLRDAAQVMDASPMAFQSLSRRRRFSRQRVLENVLVYQNRLVTFHIPPLHCLLERTRKVTLNQGSDVLPLQCPDSLYCYPGTHSTTRIMPLGCLTWGGAGAYENSGGGTFED